ncbi:hypothetical protein [Streptomyces hoynatensis]|uniref:DUF2716 domain-containing protein n=1 Tax=Streptomyces hoynatensis TaxID=1141874 RepID=A0A3A9Z9I2_9ACTN|nr:hypothetical protein [Streptomyces hoynatensis]RKN45011.1 hypothetical protein D7294_07915 [Streptomyces hoynatensis]
MPLIPCSDLSPADWIVSSELPWDRLVGFGPSGFPAYARLRFLPDPAFPGQSENDVEAVGDETEEERLRALFGLLAAHTGTPEDCCFCLWDGYGDIYGGDAVSVLVVGEDGGERPVPRVAPAFPPEVLGGPKVVIPHRSYFLFRGPLSAACDWGAAEMWPGQPRLDMPGPAFAWPADHAWCVAHDVDPHWAGIGADAGTIDRLLADPRLDVVPADPGRTQPAYR